ncbi:T9SS type A sorting domain-containing protein [Flavobacterium sp.]|uniref:T9SS type A sorting domain-containing protein n=1 Tax=Flavobacterium sp. TaxID=239 RepID=UPI003526DE82
MKNKLLLLTLILSVFFSNAQITENYKQLSKEDNANYYTIVASARAEFASKDLNVLENKKAKKQFERWALYWKDRVNQDGTFPSELQGYFNAGILNADGKIAKRQQNLSARSSTQTWTNIGPEQSELNNNGYPNYPQMGRLNAFLRIKHPTDVNQDVLFVGAPNGGIWKSTDGGANWTPKLDMVAGIGVTDIETTPDATFANYTTKPIYVSTGDYDGTHVRSIGVLKSTDGGETYNSTGLSYSLPQQKTLGDLIVIDDNTVFVGGSDNILKTIDGGTNWTTAHASGFSNVFMGRAARNGNEIMFTGAFGDVYYTSDYTNDANWNTVVSASSYNKAAVTVDDNGDFYIQDAAGQVKKYDKTGGTFSDIGNVPSGYNSQQGYNQALIVTNDIMITGEFNGQSSTDNGSNWTRSLNGYWNNSSSPGTYIHSDHHRMGRRDGALEFWSVNDGGLDYITYSSASSTTPTIDYKSSKVKVLQSYSIAINPSANDGAVITANQDNDAMSKHNGTWYAVAMGDGIQSAINYNNPAIRYASQQSGFVSQTNTGFQGQLQGNGNTVQIPGASFYHPLEMHKTNPDILYGGGNEVYKLDASSGLTITNANSGIGSSSDKIITIATHGNSVIAATNTAIRFSSDQGGSWSTISTTGISGGNITSLDYDATNNSIIYATVSGYTSGSKVFKTTNGGSSWSNISGNLPNIVVKEVMLKQGQTQEFLFVATELGVYYTADGGTSWTRLGQGLPNVDVRDIEIHYTADKLVAGTFGRGLWEISIINSSLGINDVSNTNVSLKVFPNPTTDLFNLNVDKDYEYIMYNVVGGVVKRGKLSSDKNTIDVTNLANNTYILRVFDNTTNKSFKVIVK